MRHDLKADKIHLRMKKMQRASKRGPIASAEGTETHVSAFTESSGFAMPRDGGRADGIATRRGVPCIPSALNRRRIPAEAARTKQRRALTDIVFDPTDIDGMLKQLEDLRLRHRELDQSIETLKLEGGDDIRVMSLKREKLRVKDRIVWLSAKITPDIIA